MEVLSLWFIEGPIYNIYIAKNTIKTRIFSIKTSYSSWRNSCSSSSERWPPALLSPALAAASLRWAPAETASAPTGEAWSYLRYLRTSRRLLRFLFLPTSADFRSLLSQLSSGGYSGYASSSDPHVGSILWYASAPASCPAFETCESGDPEIQWGASGSATRRSSLKSFASAARWSWASEAAYEVVRSIYQ